MGSGEISQQQIIINEITEKLKKNKLLIEEEGKSRLDLGKFNDNLKLASENLGEIIPGIVQISKEQVALINHGLEGVINFISSFQTLNTAFAIFAEKPLELSNYSGRIKDIENLEEFIVKDVNSTLVNMEAMLKSTFKEVAVYYTALANIIYSEEEEGVIKFDYKRDANLERMLDEIMGKDRRKDIKKNPEKPMKKSLGLVQIIQSLVNVSKEVRKITLPDKEKMKEIEETYIKVKEGNEIKKITINVDIIESLKSISAQLLDSLNNVGLFIKKENEEVKIIEQIGFEEILLTQNGTNAIFELGEKLKAHKKITDFFIESTNKIKKLNSYEVKDSDKAKIFEEISSIVHEQNNAKKVHDEIVKKQMDLIIEVVNTFASVVSLWGHQVDKEISIAQVADKTSLALEKLMKVQIQSLQKDATESLLIASETQKSIMKTCSEAKELKTVGKVMQYLLKRVKDLISFNRGLENEIKSARNEVTNAKDYKTGQLKEIKKVLYERYPDKAKKVSKIINDFNNKIKHLVDRSNQRENNDFIGKLIQDYEEINKALINSILTISKETEKVEENVSIFPESCKRLGLVIDSKDNKIDKMFDKLNDFNKIFSDDFRVYKELSSNYKDFVEGIKPFMEIINYISSTQKSLISKKIELKELNIYLNAFLKVFKDRREIQNEEAKIDSELSKVMKEVKMDKDHYYDKYKERMGKSFELLQELERFTEEYFKDSKDKLGTAYKMAEDWTEKFSFEFKEYNSKLKDMNYGFFQKLFQTKDYKEKDFFSELKSIENSFPRIDAQINKLSRLNLKQANDVPSFCKISVTFVNEMLSGYRELIEQMTKVVSVINIINNNLKKIDEKTIAILSKFLDKMDENNKKINKVEADFDFTELAQIDVSSIKKSLENLTSFSELSKKSESQLTKINKVEPVVKKTVEDFKNYLLIFYTTYLTQVLSGKDKEKYEKILKEAQSNI